MSKYSLFIFAALLVFAAAYVIYRLYLRTKPECINVFNKKLTGADAHFFGKLINKYEYINCDELPHFGYTNFQFSPSGQPSFQDVYYTFVSKTGTLYKANTLKYSKLPEGMSKYEQIPVNKRESRHLRRIFRLY